MLFIPSFKSRILRNWLGYLIFWQLFLRFSEARGVLSCASGSHWTRMECLLLWTPGRERVILRWAYCESGPSGEDPQWSSKTQVSSGPTVAMIHLGLPCWTLGPHWPHTEATTPAAGAEAASFLGGTLAPGPHVAWQSWSCLESRASPSKPACLSSSCAVMSNSSQPPLGPSPFSHINLFTSDPVTTSAAWRTWIACRATSLDPCWESCLSAVCSEVCLLYPWPAFWDGSWYVVVGQRVLNWTLVQLNVSGPSRPWLTLPWWCTAMLHESRAEPAVLSSVSRAEVSCRSIDLSVCRRGRHHLLCLFAFC